MQEATLVVALSSVHGMTCPLPLLEAVEYAFGVHADAIPAQPSRKLPAASAQPDATPAAQGHNASNVMPAKRRRYMAPCIPPLALDSQQASSWRSAKLQAQELPLLLQVHCAQKLPTSGTMHARVHLHFSQDADALLQHQALTVRVPLGSQQLPRCAAGTPHSQAWAAATHTEAELLAVTQV